MCCFIIVQVQNHPCVSWLQIVKVLDDKVHPNIWNMPTLETPGRQSIQALFMLLLAFLSQALGLLEKSMGPYDKDDCSLQAWELG